MPDRECIGSHHRRGLRNESPGLRGRSRCDCAASVALCRRNRKRATQCDLRRRCHRPRSAAARSSPSSSPSSCPSLPARAATDPTASGARLAQRRARGQRPSGAVGVRRRVHRLGPHDRLHPRASPAAAAATHAETAATTTNVMSQRGELRHRRRLRLARRALRRTARRSCCYVAEGAGRRHDEPRRPRHRGRAARPHADERARSRVASPTRARSATSATASGRRSHVLALDRTTGGVPPEARHVPDRAAVSRRAGSGSSTTAVTPCTTDGEADPDATAWRSTRSSSTGSTGRVERARTGRSRWLVARQDASGAFAGTGPTATLEREHDGDRRPGAAGGRSDRVGATRPARGSSRCSSRRRTSARSRRRRHRRDRVRPRVSATTRSPTASRRRAATRSVVRHHRVSSRSPRSCCRRVAAAPAARERRACRPDATISTDAAAARRQGRRRGERVRPR